MDHFYGGPNGQSFAVKKIFSNRTALDADKLQGWTSSIQPGEFVIVFYGMQNDDPIDGAEKNAYQQNRDIDLNNYNGKTYNSTLWEKTYDESARNTATRGIDYRLLASMTGNTPLIKIVQNVIDAGEAVELVYDGSNIDNPILTFNFPAHYIWSYDVDTTTPLAGASVSVTTSGAYNEQLKLTLRVPDAWDIVTGDVLWRVPGTDPVASITQRNETTKQVNFTLPKSQLFTLTREDDLGADQGIAFVEVDPTASDESDGVLDTRNFIYQLPKSWKLLMEHEYISATDDPYIAAAAGVDSGSPIDTKTWTIKLPKTWSLKLLRVLQNAEISPSIDDEDGADSASGADGLIDTKTWTLNLPKAWDLKVDYEEIDPSEDIDLTVDVSRGAEVDTKTWTFHLPKAWDIDIQRGNILDPKIAPAVRHGTDTNDTKEFLVDIPRPVYFYYGTLLGERSAGSYELTDPIFADYAIGDYYINEATGFIYEITGKSDATTCTFTYRACIQSPLPTVVYHEIDPYDADGKPATPTVVRTLTNAEGTAWQLDFGLPKFPEVEHDFEFVGVDEAGKVTLEVSDVDKLKFGFTIPRGSKIYSGIEITKSNDPGFITIDGSLVAVKPGDVYVNSDSGKIYTWDGATGLWKVADGSLKGPAGDPINIIAKYSIETDEDTTTLWDADNNYEHLIDWAAQQYEAQFGSGVPADNEVIDVQWIRTVSGSQSQQFFWIHYLTGDSTTPAGQKKWHVDLLTGNVGNIFMNSYGTSSTQGYTADYINSLIGGVLDITDPSKQTYSEKTFDSIWGWGTWDANGILYDSMGNEMRFIVPAGTAYYPDATMATQIGTVQEHMYADQVDAQSGKIEISGVTYYVKREDMVSGHLYDDVATYSAKEIDYLLSWGRFPSMVKS